MDLAQLDAICVVMRRNGVVEYQDGTVRVLLGPMPHAAPPEAPSDDGDQPDDAARREEIRERYELSLWSSGGDPGRLAAMEMDLEREPQ